MSVQRRITIVAAGLLAAAGIVLPAQPAQAFLAVITFDATAAPCFFSETNPLRDEYAGRGIHFRGPSSTDGGAILDQCGMFGVDARSGSNFLAFNTRGTTQNLGTARGPETISFDRPRKHVQIFVSQGLAGNSATFKLIAKRAGNTVASSSATTTTNDYRRLRVDAADGFSKVILKGTTANGAWVADDLTVSS